MDINPFDLDDNETYLRWRESKLKDYPTKFDNLLVEVNNPRKLRQREFDAAHKAATKQEKKDGWIREPDGWIESSVSTKTAVVPVPT